MAHWPNEDLTPRQFKRLCERTRGGGSANYFCPEVIVWWVTNWIILLGAVAAVIFV